MDTAQRHDDLAGEKFLLLGADPRPHAGNAPAVEYEPAHDCVAGDAEIAAAAYSGIEIADRRRGALPRPVAHRHRAIAVAKITVHIGDERNLPFPCESVHRFCQRRPFVRFGAPDRDRSCFAMQRPVKIPVVFQLAIIRKDAVPAPSRRAKHFPFGVIVGRATMGHHAHHGRTAAHDAALRKSDRWRVVLAPPMHLEAGPEISVVVIGPRIGIEHVSRLAAGRRVPPGLQQKDFRCRPR